MKVLIIEDETAAAKNLQAILRQVCPDAEVLEVLDTVVESVEWLRTNDMPDLVFMDIHLSDGDSFRIFDNVEVSAPIVFTTAYDQYALEAFKVNSIDYLLKPINEQSIVRALDKWRLLTGSERENYAARVKEMAARHNSEKQVFLVRFRDKIIPVSSDNVAYCYSSNEKVSICTLKGDNYPIERTLESLYGSLSSERFFRANRQFIVSREAIKDISVWFGSRLALNLTVETPERIVVSKARVPEFKAWLTDRQP